MKAFEGAVFGSLIKRNGNGWKKTGGLAGIVSGVLFALLWLAAAVVNPEWRFGTDTLSELGGDDAPSRWLFNLGCMVSGVLGIIFSLGLYGKLLHLRAGRLGGALMAVASAGLIFVGIFSIDTGTAHSAATVFFFSTVATAAIVILYSLITAGGSCRGAAALTGVVIAISLASLALVEIPLAEAVTVICLLCWMSAMGYWLLLSRPGER